jgi:hypothetical protein
MTAAKPPVPMGEMNYTMRVCSRLSGRDVNGGEVLCGQPATVHVIYQWNDVDGLEHGFACPEHWHEFQARWSCAGHHEVNAVCGMPGSTIAGPNESCRLDDLPTAEPTRCVAVPFPVSGRGKETRP